MQTPSFFSRAKGTLKNPLSKAVDSMREVVAHHAGESDEQKLLENMLQLFVFVLRADGSISSMEQQAVTTLVRDNYGEAAANKLQQMPFEILSFARDAPWKLACMSPLFRYLHP